jgi:V8-like Glu-specific endopeptidase
LAVALDTSGFKSVKANSTRMRYSANTEGGSSGSRCFDIHWSLIALHHSGDPLRDQAQYNQGIPISAIRERLERQGRAAFIGEQAPI